MDDKIKKELKHIIGDETLRKIADVVPSEEIHWDMNARREFLKTVNNVINFFRVDPGLVGVLKKNLFSNEIEIVKKPVWDKYYRGPRAINDEDTVLLKGYLSEHHRFDVPINTVVEAITNIAHESAYHPVKEYLESIHWDGTPRVETWLIDHLGCDDNLFVRAVAKKFMVAAVTRIYEPGCIFATMLIFEGKQGLGKSSACRILGGQWHKELSIFSEMDKDAVAAMMGTWIVEVSELAKFKRAEVEAVKAFVSKPVDRVRLSYARIPTNFPRQSVFVGTVNPDDSGYLKDDTGNRRYWPVECKKELDQKRLQDERDQLWAEAYQLYRSKSVKIYIDDEILHELAREEQRAREIEEPWTEIVEAWLAIPDNASGPHTSVEVAMGALELDASKVGHFEKIRVSKAMKNLGWENRVTRKNGRIIKQWFKKSVFFEKPSWED